MAPATRTLNTSFVWTDDVPCWLDRTRTCNGRVNSPAPLPVGTLTINAPRVEKRYFSLDTAQTYRTVSIRHPRVRGWPRSACLAYVDHSLWPNLLVQTFACPTVKPALLGFCLVVSPGIEPGQRDYEPRIMPHIPTNRSGMSPRGAQ